jgi:hypothetical protein
MGGCCFTPTKKDFLWWYWLLLASIVGIPMLVAVLYVAWRPNVDDETKKRRGKTAAWIFWGGTFLVAMAAFAVAKALLLAIYPYPDPADAFSYWDWAGHHYSEGFSFLALHFFCATVAANGADSLVRKGKGYVRIPVLVLFLALYLLVLSFLDNVILMHHFDIRRPAINVMQFLACMVPAHYWGNFKASSDSSRAWKALAAFLVGATLFFLVSYFGEDFAQWVCGPPGSGKGKTW